MDDVALEKTKSAFLLKIGERLVFLGFYLQKYLKCKVSDHNEITAFKRIGA